MRHTRWIWLALAAASGCADLSKLERNVCGNGVVDPGEDCDTAAPAGTSCIIPGAPNECRFQCSAIAACPSGWGCDADNLCSQPAGSYTAAPSDLRMPGDGLEIGDVDGDGANDLIGAENDTIAVRYGPGFDTRTDSLAPGRTGTPITLRFDGASQSTLDFAIPMEAGVYNMRGRSDRRLSPVPYASVPIALPSGSKTLPVLLDADGVFGNEGILMAEQFMIFVLPEPPFMDEPMLLGLYPIKTGIMRWTLSELASGGTAGVPVDIPVADVDADNHEEYLLVFTGDTRAHLYGARTEIVRAVPVLRPFEKYTISLPGTVAGPGRLVDFDADNDIDVAVPVLVGGVLQVAVARSSGGTLPTFALGAVEPVFDAMKAAKCDDDVWPLAMGFLNLDQRIDFVGNGGVCLGNGDGLTVTLVAGTARPWTDAIIADLNADILPDVAAGSNTVGVDVLLGNASGLFNFHRVATDSPVVGMRAGDFDGDFVRDLAVVERDDLSGSMQPQQLSVMYGNRQGPPTAPVRQGALGMIVSMSRVTLTVGPQPDLTDDLIILTRSLDGSMQALAAMFGSTQRVLLAPFLLEGSARNQVGATAVAAGEFTGDGVPDVLALTPGELFLLKGSGDGNAGLTRAAQLPLLGLTFGTCVLTAARNLGKPGLALDQVVAIDGAASRSCIETMNGVTVPVPRSPTIVIVTPSGGVGVPTFEKFTVPGDYKEPRLLQLVDLDGDAKPELLVLYGGAKRDLVIYPNTDGILKIDQGRAVAGVTGSLLGMAAVQANGDARKELALLSDRGVFLATAGSDGSYTAATTPVVFPGEANDTMARFVRAQIAVADLDGDGVDDLAVVRDQLLRVYRGDRTRDVAALQGDK